ncbi:MAG: hypothetical protein PVI57_00350 [Gemmatimonadota bacterium]
MILAHLAELHLGFRAYERTRRGRNARERDVAAAFERAVQEVGRIGPDLVLIAGDIFDRADPTPSALLTFTRGLDALRSSLAPEVRVVLAGGARDAPLRPGDASGLSVVESIPGIDVATGTARTLHLHPDVHVCLIPYRAALRDPFPVPAPDPRARHNVLLAYGAALTEGPGVPVDPEEWGYVALGGEHTWRKVAPNVAYAGSLERVGPNPWGEAAEEKGFVTFDLEVGRMRFHPLPVRPVVSLAPVRTPETGVGDLPARVREVTDEIPGGLDDKIVRLRIRGASPRDVLTLQGELLSGLSRRALHLDVEVEDGTPPRSPSAEELLRPRLAEEPELAHRVQELLAGEAKPDRPPAPRIRIVEDDPLLGTVKLRVPEGFVGVVSEETPATRRLLRLAAGPGEGLRLPWVDPEPASPDRVLAALEDVLARSHGVGPLEAALAALSPPPEAAGAGEELRAEEVESLEDLDRRLTELEGAERELHGLERELRDLRADHAEVAGDLEQATMEWLRERQDAETHLQAYRDRARELRARLGQIEEAGSEAPCPTCGRLLLDHFDEVVDELREEWESVVQDGSWWKRRREQLDPKPGNLQDLEGRALRLQAAVEACSERLESSRSRVRERDEVRQRIAELRAGPAPAAMGEGAQPSGDPPQGVAGILGEVVGRLRAHVRERLLARASRYVAILTGSRVLVLTADGSPGALRLEGPMASIEAGDEELAAAETCLRLAGAALTAEDEDRPTAVILPLELVERLHEHDRVRLIDLLPSLRGRVRHVLVGMHADTAEKRQEVLDAVLELRPVGPQGPAHRWLAAGRSRLVISAVRPEGRRG